MTTSKPTSVYVMRCKANPVVVTPLVFVSERKPQSDFLIFRTCLKYCSVMTNVRNDQCVGLHVEDTRDNVSFMAILGFKIYYRRKCGLADGKCLGTVHHLFIDLKTTYDSVRREVL